GCNQRDVDLARGGAVLECIVEHSNRCTHLRCSRNSVSSTRLDNHGHFWIESFMNQSFIAAVSAKYDCRSLAATQKLRCNPRGKRRLARAPDGKISNTYYGNLRALDGKHFMLVHPGASRGDGAI